MGVFIKPYRIYIGNKTKQDFYSKIGIWNEIAEKTEGIMGSEKIVKFIACANSYLGIMGHYKTYRLRKNMVNKNPSDWWWNYLYLSGGISKFTLRRKS